MEEDTYIYKEQICKNIIFFFWIEESFLIINFDKVLKKKGFHFFPIKLAKLSKIETLSKYLSSISYSVLIFEVKKVGFS
jgi:hypothetical protein